MRQMPLPWVAAKTLTSRETNTLTLNTHIDTTIALKRAGRLLGKDWWTGEVASADRALHRILALRPAETLYRALFWALSLTLLPRRQAQTLGLAKRTVRYVARTAILPRWSRFKAWRPRLVMPGGYVDRAVTAGKLADPYHSINLMDLARYAQVRPSTVVDNTFDDGVRFIQRSRIHHYWVESPKKAYALGFVAEALCRRCLSVPDESLRAFLAEIIILLEQARVGLPPAALGANAEAVPADEQVPCLVTRDPALKVVNLSRRGAWEYLCINTGDESRDPPTGNGIEWSVRGGQTAEATPWGRRTAADRIPAKGWAVAKKTFKG